MAGHTTEVAKYLSQEWIDDLDRAARTSDLVRAAAPDLVFVVQHEVTGTPEGIVRYHIEFQRGTARLHAGEAESADACFTEDHATAVAVSSGEINAQSAFMTGRLRVRGDMEKLIAAQPAIEALDKALEGARARTTYA
jgi:putative sterol carrier protein